MANNITRTMNIYDIKAYDVVDSVDGLKVEVICEAEAVDSNMTSGKARAALAEVSGKKMPRGCTVKWEKTGRIVYAMPLEDFIAAASILEIE